MQDKSYENDAATGGKSVCVFACVCSFLFISVGAPFLHQTSKIKSRMSQNKRQKWLVERMNSVKSENHTLFDKYFDFLSVVSLKL